MTAKQLRRWLKVTAVAVAGVLFGVTLGLAVVSVLATQFFNYHLLTVESTSMVPALKKGDLVVVRPSSITKVHEGDIIYFDAAGNVPTVHRAVAVNRIITTLRDGKTQKIIGQETDFRITTKGDANVAPDAGQVTPANFRGNVWFHLPTFGLLTSTGIQPQVLLFGVAGLIALLWAAWETAHIGRRRRAAQAGHVAANEAPGARAIDEPGGEAASP